MLVMKNDSSNKENEISLKLSFVIGAIIGAAIFIMIYGVRVLDVSYDDFLFFYEQDPAQHYMGWQLFRNSDWHFPLGLTDACMYPEMTSVVFTDSMPLFSVILKVFSPILPDTFQFIGIYALLCFMLQGGFAKLLLRRYIKSEVTCCIGSVLFIINIAFVQRIFLHTALASHFFILAALTLHVYRNVINSMRKRVILWVILGVTCVSIHIYIYAMVSALLLGYSIVEAIEKNGKFIEKIKVFGLFFGTYLTASVIVFYILGGFYGKVDSEGIGLGTYSANINMLFNPQGYSSFGFTLPALYGQEDSLCYVGISVIILMIPALIAIIKAFKEIWKNHKKEIVIMGVINLLLFIFALSPVVSINNFSFEYMSILPDSIVKLWGIFRSTGRFMWPIEYLIMLIAIVYSEKIIKRPFPIILAVLVMVQVFEFSSFFIQQHKNFSPELTAVFAEDTLQKYDFSKYKHIQFMTEYGHVDFYGDEVCYNTFAGYSRLAANKRMTISNFHFSRDYKESVSKQIDLSFQEILSGNIREDTIYVFDKNQYMQLDLGSNIDNKIEYDMGDGTILILPN